MTVVDAPAVAPVKTKEEKAAESKAKRAERVNFRFDPELFPKPEGVSAEEWEGGPKLTTPERPKGYITTKHTPLGKADFADEMVYLEYQARKAEQKAKNLRAEIETIKKLGNVADRGKAKKLISMQSRMADLARELAADGDVDLASILGADALAALLGNGSVQKEVAAEATAPKGNVAKAKK